MDPELRAQEKRVGDLDIKSLRPADASRFSQAWGALYRAAQAIAVRDLRGEADTEELRKAVVHYRTLFDELFEVRVPVRDVPPVEPRAVHA